MAITFDDWIKQTQGRYWDMDGAYGAQCWDLWAKYSMDMYGLSIQDCITPTGYAEGCYTRFPYTAALDNVYEKMDANYTPVKGDVVFWTFGGQIYTGSHVAIVCDGVTGDNIDVLTQNPTPAVHQTLPLLRGSQLLGYLHPKNLQPGGTTPGNPNGGNPTGGDNQGSGVSGGSSAWIQQQGDNLIYHYGSRSGGMSALFVKTTAQNWIYRGASGTGAPDGDGGQSSPSVGDGESSYALYVVGTVESSLQWDAVEPNRQGIGIAQWSFGRRLQVLNAMKAVDADGYRTFAAAAPDIAALMNSGGTFDRAMTGSEVAAFQTWAQRAQSHAGQRAQFATDYEGYPQKYDDAKMQILWTCAYHQSPAGALNVPTATTLAGLRDNILATSPFGPYGTRYQTAYSLLNVWDGKSAPPNF